MKGKKKASRVMAKHKYYQIIIAGAGPSGMTAALYCARQGYEVLLIDRNTQAGRKLLVTGNGRCNLTNMEQKMADYRSEDPELAWSMVRSFHESRTLEFLADLGIYTTVKEGYIYPYSGQAATVREAFERALQQEKKIRFLPETEVVDVSCAAPRLKETESLKSSCCFRVKTRRNSQGLKPGSGKREAGDSGRREEDFTCSCLLIATGGLAGEKFGCHGDGYRFAAKAGHRLVRQLPALTALKTSAPFVKKLSGIRCPAEISILADGTLLGKETGELQWTDYGISGVAVFQLSRFAVCALEEGKKVEARISFLPDLAGDDLRRLMVRTGGKDGQRTLTDVFSGIFPKKMVQVLVRETGCTGDERVRQLTERDWERIEQAVLTFSLRISGCMGFEKAQTTRGGVSLQELTGQMESRFCQGLFFSGEVADVDGTCGGYNLQWAFSSGHKAAEGIVSRMRKFLASTGRVL